MFDDIGADSYQGGDNVLLQGGVISNFALKLLPHQGLILVPGGADTRYRQPTPSEWVSYAQFTWPSAAAWSCAPSPGARLLTSRCSGHLRSACAAGGV